MSELRPACVDEGRPASASAIASDLLVAMGRAEPFAGRRFEAAPREETPIEFLAFVAHELRSPLAPIRTAASMITRGRPEDLALAQAVIERQVDHLARLIADLLDLARCRTGRLTLARSQVELGDVVEQALVVCRPPLARRLQRLELSVEARPCTLHADGLRLVQIITNLVDNASKFSPDGACVRLSVRRIPSAVELVVADEGLGMDEATLSNAFEPFVQAPHAAVSNRSGLGIGLVVVR